MNEMIGGGSFTGTAVPGPANPMAASRAGKVSSKHLEGISDLTLSAPIKPGFITAFEAVTYETRLELVMDALFKIRTTAREYSLIKPFVDTAERIQSLLDFRLAIIDGPPDEEGAQTPEGGTKRLLLSATFDRPLEPYMRLIWHPLGSLLDLVFCNCEGYVTATQHDFEKYLRWVRSAQIDSDFFYAATGHSVDDVQYMSQIEKLQRQASDCDAAAAAVTIADLEEKAARIRNDPRTVLESNEMAVEALVALYRLADFYPPDDLPGDGQFLLRATQDLLAGWDTEALPKEVQLRFRDQLTWFRTKLPPVWFEDPKNVVPEPELSDVEKANFQPGILATYDQTREPITHGCLLLMRIKDPASVEAVEKARAFAQSLGDRIWDGWTPEEAEGRRVHVNLAFTRSGLANFGVPPAEMAKLPQEFHEGMEARAGLLGDMRDSHPRRWKLPKRYRPKAPLPAPEAKKIAASSVPVGLSEVDFIVQLRIHADYRGHDVLAGDHPLHAALRSLEVEARAAGVELLAVESMRRASADPFSPKDHFGFADGLSQPALAAMEPAVPPRDQVKAGEIFWGRANDRRDPKRREPDMEPDSGSNYFNDGSFLVIRKLRQDVGGLERFLTEQASKIPDLDREDLLAKMMGRTRSGVPLLPGSTSQSNDFDYANDRDGRHCPFQSHVRRTNPRVTTHGRPTPRIVRRGLSYGPPYQTHPHAERGVFFMVYNGSIAEQFEVVQRWVNGGNSSGVASCQADPLMGLHADNEPRTFRFHHNGRLYRVPVPRPFVTLEWGAYLFAPSREGLKHIATALLAPPEPAADGAEGERIIQMLEELADRDKEAAALAWKACLEDFGSKDPAERNKATGIWAAIRDLHGGVLKVPYTDSDKDPPTVIDAVLVASKELVDKVYDNKQDFYTVESPKGPGARMDKSFGLIFLGRDRTDPNYLLESQSINEEILAVTEREAFELAYDLAKKRLEGMLAMFQALSKERGAKLDLKIDLRREFITPVLADVCASWFGIPDQLVVKPGEPFHVAAGGWSWDRGERKPRCPGDYISPSRYCFYPDPLPKVRDYGKADGQRLQDAVRQYFAEYIAAKKVPGHRLAKPIFENEAFGGDPKQMASAVVGVMMGFLPPADGSLRWTLYEWIKEKTLWRLQHDVAAHPDPDPYVRAKAALDLPLRRAMQKRPSPDLLWRAVKTKHKLGEVTITPKDRVIIGIVSATAELMAKGSDNVYPIFGGKRPGPPASDEPPTHACPGYKAAMGTMLGMLAALLETGRIEELPSPLIVLYSNPLAPPVPPPADRTTPS